MLGKEDQACIHIIIPEARKAQRKEQDLAESRTRLRQYRRLVRHQR
jgi:hypothetical protein